MKKEIWKDVVGYEGLYQVSDCGRVKRLDGEVQRKYKNKIEILPIKGRILKPFADGKYLKYVLCKNGVGKTEQAHTLVLNAFVGPRPNGYDACHFPDRNGYNNRLDNLRWDTKSNNQRDRLFHGTDGRGEKNGRATITNDIALKIKKMLLNNSMKYVSDNLNVNYYVVNQIKRGNNWAWLKI